MRIPLDLRTLGERFARKSVVNFWILEPCNVRRCGELVSVSHKAPPISKLDLAQPGCFAGGCDEKTPAGDYSVKYQTKASFDAGS
jgi:hypothetical protein